MTRLTIDILNSKEEALFMSILEAFKKQKVIRLKKEKIPKTASENYAMPGSPMTEEELEKIVDKAEKGIPMTYEQIKHRFEI